MTPESLMQMLRALLTPQAFDEMVAGLGTMSNKTRIDPMGGQTTVDALGGNTQIEASPAGAFEEQTFIRPRPDSMANIRRTNIPGIAPGLVEIPSQSSPFTPPNALRMGGSAGNGLPGTRELPPGPLNIPGPRPLGSPPPIPAPGPPIPGRKPLPRGGPQPIPPPAQPADDFIARLRGNLPRLPGESTNIMAGPAMREQILAAMGGSGGGSAGGSPPGPAANSPAGPSGALVRAGQRVPAGSMPPIDVSWAPVEAPGGVRPGFPPQMPMLGAGGGGSGASIPPSAPPFPPTNTLMSRLGQVGRLAGTGLVGLGALDTANMASQGRLMDTLASGLGTVGGANALWGIGGRLGAMAGSLPVAIGAMLARSNDIDDGTQSGWLRRQPPEVQRAEAEKAAIQSGLSSTGVYDIDRLADMDMPFDPSRFQGPGGMLSRTAFAPAKRKGPPGNAGRSKAAGTYTGDVIEPMNLTPPGMKLEPRGPMGLGNFQLQPGLTPNRKPLLPTPGQSETGGAADVEDTFDNLELLQLLRQQMGTGEVGARFDAPRRPMGDFSGDASSAAMMRDREALRRRTGGIRPSPSGTAYMDAPGDLDPLGRRPRSSL